MSWKSEEAAADETTADRQSLQGEAPGERAVTLKGAHRMTDPCCFFPEPSPVSRSLSLQAGGRHCFFTCHGQYGSMAAFVADENIMALVPCNQFTALWTQSPPENLINSHNVSKCCIVHLER